MRLKLLTSAALLAGVLLLLAGPWAVKSPGEGASAKALAEYGLRGLIYFALVSSLFLGSAVGAFALMKKQLQQFREARDRNLEELIKGSMRDHEKRG